MLLKKVQQAGATGIRLTRLWAATRIVSAEVKRLLADVALVNASPKGRDILYRWIGTPEKTVEESRIQESQPAAAPLPEPIGEPDAELELTRTKLVVLLEKSYRHLSWLANYLDPVGIKRVLDRWPEDFVTMAQRKETKKLRESARRQKHKANHTRRRKSGINPKTWAKQ